MATARTKKRLSPKRLAGVFVGLLKTPCVQTYPKKIRSENPSPFELRCTVQQSSSIGLEKGKMAIKGKKKLNASILSQLFFLSKESGSCL